VGILQWLVLRQHIPHSGLWLLASATGWAVGVPAAQAIEDVLALFISGEIVGFAVLCGVIAAMAGGTTGLVLTWLMHGARRLGADSRLLMPAYRG